MQLIKSAWTEQVAKTAWQFEALEIPGTYFAFDCDPDGTLKPFPSDAARENYQRCIEHPERFKNNGVVCWRWQVRHPAVLRCDCGGSVELSAFTNTCTCGADYNASGQLLAPRECWGEETGEHPSECV